MIAPLWLSLYQRLRAQIAAIAVKREEIHTGVSNGNGDFTVVYSPAFPVGVVPHVNPQQIPQTDPNRSLRVTAASNTGFTIRAEVRATLNVLGLNVIDATPTALANVAISVLVREP